MGFSKIIKTRLFATKSVDALLQDANAMTGFKRTLTLFDLIFLGIGIIGTGIFVLAGRVAAAYTGPAVTLSFILAGFAAFFAALCYAEMASMIPVSGSAYTYAYATLGELVAWLMGWDLILEYLVTAATATVGWSGYVGAFLKHITGHTLPQNWTTAPIAFLETEKTFVLTGSYINLPAVFITCIATILLFIGTRASARFNSTVVFIKIIVIGMFVLFSVRFVNPANWHPFIPDNLGEFGKFGVSGIFKGASMVFFAYVGFDAVSTAALEARHPQRDVPLGILISLLLCTCLYIAVALVLTGLVHYPELSVAHPMAAGVAATGQLWLETVVDLGAIAGLTSVVLVFLMAQSRVFFTMAHDGLLPKMATRLHPRFGTPHITTCATGVMCACAGGLLPLELLCDIAGIGTLFAFILVSLGIGRCQDSWHPICID